MGAVADGALARGGTVRGILPRFMMDLEWGHPKLTELRIVEDLRIRKHLMLSESHGLVALPGGCGTLEELFEALTLKRLGLYVHPIVLLNTRNYFAPLIELLNHAVEERFMGNSTSPCGKSSPSPRRYLTRSRTRRRGRRTPASLRPSADAQRAHMKILLTGSAGHLGEALAQTLATEHEVVGLDVQPSPFTSIVGSIADPAVVARAMRGVNAVLHTATLHKPHVVTHSRREFVDANVVGTLTLLEEAAAASRPLLHLHEHDERLRARARARDRCTCGVDHRRSHPTA